MTAALDADSSARTTPRRSRAPWWIAFVVLSTLGGLWAVSGPLFSVPDEPAHVVYSAAVARGQFFAPTEGIDTTVVVPRTYAAAFDTPACYRYDGSVPAGCAPPYVAQSGEAEVVTTAGRYPPVYYLSVGWVTLLTDGAPAVYLMRLLTVLMCAALLASAVVSARETRSRWPVAGILLATTPMVLFFSGAVNPQGPEIAAGIGLWAAGLALLSSRTALPGDPADAGTGRLVARLVVAAAALAVIRPMSIVWLGLALGCILLARATSPALRQLLRHRGLLLGIAGVTALVLVTGVWVVARDALRQWSRPNDAPLERAAVFSVSKLDVEFHEMVGVFGWLDTWAPGLVYFIWFGAVGALLLMAWAVGDRRERLALAAIVVVSVVMPVASELGSYRESSFAWQGRYILAFTAGLAVLSGFVLAGRIPAGTTQRACRALVVAVGVAQVVAFVGNLNRYVHGVQGFWFIDEAAWQPPLPASVLVVAFTAAVAAAVVLLLRGDLAADEAPGGSGTQPLRGRPPAASPALTGLHI